MPPKPIRERTMKRARTIHVYGIKHIPTNEIVLPVFPQKAQAERYMYDNYVAPSKYFKLVKVELKELPSKKG